MFLPVNLEPVLLGLGQLIQLVPRFWRLLTNMPATGGLRELAARGPKIRSSVNSICGIAYCMTDPATMITSAQCLYGARAHVVLDVERGAINDLLLAHQARTGWPDVDITTEMRRDGTESIVNS